MYAERTHAAAIVIQFIFTYHKTFENRNIIGAFFHLKY